MTDDANRIHDRIDELAKGVDERIGEVARAIGEISGDVKEIAATCKPCRQRVDRLSTLVGGNGNEGLRDRMTRTEETQKQTTEQIEKIQASSSKWSDRATTTTTGIVVGVVVGLVVAFFG